MQTMLSGIKPTGRLTLGNYIGAIRQFIQYQDEYDMYIFIAIYMPSPLQLIQKN